MSARLVRAMLLLSAQRMLPEQQALADRMDVLRAPTPSVATPRTTGGTAAFVGGMTPSGPLTGFEFERQLQRDVHASRAAFEVRQPYKNQWRRRRRRYGWGLAMDVDGPPNVSTGGGDGVAVQEEARWQKEERKMSAGLVVEGVELPSVQAPSDLPQPGEWLQVPQQGLGRGSSPKSTLYPGFAIARGDKKDSTLAKIPVDGETKPDPFAEPDNDYKDSFLDSLWINLLSSRMSAAVEAEARAGTASDGSGGARKAPATAMTGARDRGIGDEIRAVPARPRPTARLQLTSVLPSGTVEAQPRAGGGMGGVYTYEDYVRLATRLQAGPPERQRQVVRGVLRSLFPAWFPAFYRTLFPRSKFSAEVNAFMCPPLFGWLVGKSKLTEGTVDIEAMDGKGPSKEVWRHTVKVERCRYLEASKCKGTCMNLCKLPTEAFFREDLGMPLRMTPNFEDLSCEFAFGQDALPPAEDSLMKEPCWTECLSSGKQPKKPQRACHTMPESPLRGP